MERQVRPWHKISDDTFNLEITLDGFDRPTAGRVRLSRDEASRLAHDLLDLLTVGADPPQQEKSPLSVAETQRLLGSDRPVSVGKVPTDPIGMRTLAARIREMRLTSTPRPEGLYRCTVCDTRWLLWPDSVHGGGWNLLDKYQQPGPCCDNVAMGEQIEHLRDLPSAGWQNKKEK